MKILAIESSCDETSCAIVDDKGVIHAHIIRSQIADHQKYAGVVPELAARKHLEICDILVDETLEQAHCQADDIYAIATTAGPGLIGSLLVGMMVGQAYALAWQKPFYSINHLEAHALSPLLNSDITFPYLLLLVSGGHSEFIYVKSVGQYQRLGKTIDDAAGEAFDKAAKLLTLPYPGGPHIEQAAINGDSYRYDLARPMRHRKGCDFSFSGLKSDLRRQIMQQQQPLNQQIIAGYAASFQQAVCDIITERAKNAIALCPDDCVYLVVAGGVAANQSIRTLLQTLAYDHEMIFHAPPLSLCTDNAAMVAWAAQMRLQHGLNLDYQPPRPRWPLEELAS